MTPQGSERSRPDLKPKFPRIKLLLAKRRVLPPRGQWFTYADGEHLVRINPNR